MFVRCDKCEKAYEYQQLKLIFIGNEKAFSHMNSNKLWEVLDAWESWVLKVNSSTELRSSMQAARAWWGPQVDLATGLK